MVPLKLAERDGVTGLQYVPPFSIAVFVLTLIIAGLDVLIRRKPLIMHFDAVKVPAIQSGIMLSIGTH